MKKTACTNGYTPISDNLTDNRRGAALLIALSLLALFAFLGTVYLRYMRLEVEVNDIAQRELRARMMAEAGFHAALADLMHARNNGGEIALDTPLEYAFPVYTQVIANPGGTVYAGRIESRRRAFATVTIHDESGKVNLNHAPASVLQRLLDIDGESARAMVSGLPGRTPAAEEGAWYLRLDDLLARELVSQTFFESMDLSLLSTFTVIDHDNPAAYLNLNTAPPRVLAAALALSDAEAEALAAQRPFESEAAFFAAVNKPSLAFAYRPEPDAAPDTLPTALALESRCFRLVAEGAFAVVDPVNPENAYHTLTGRVEAVVLFEEAGDEYSILYWNTHR